jgi:hypothetical protein
LPRGGSPRRLAPVSGKQLILKQHHRIQIIQTVGEL